MKRVLIFLFALVIFKEVKADICADWLKQSGIQKGPRCEDTCVLLVAGKVGMGSSCHGNGVCHDFCKRNISPTPSSSPGPYVRSLLKPLVLYPALDYLREHKLVVNKPQGYIPQEPVR